MEVNAVEVLPLVVVTAGLLGRMEKNVKFVAIRNSCIYKTAIF